MGSISEIRRFKILESIKFNFETIFQKSMSLSPERQKESASSSPKREKSPLKSGYLGQQSRPNEDSPIKSKEEMRGIIDLGIDRFETRSATFTKYVAYHITGSDKNGAIDVFRRFSEFYKMRVDLVKRFPGCFIPSIPQKTITLIDDQVPNKRQRYLNDFLKRIAKLPHLYNSEEFQALLRSIQKDLSGTFEKWPNPTSTDIINKYKESFSFLSGKVIDATVKENIASFAKLIQRTNVYLYNFKLLIKSVAVEKDKFNKALSPLLTKCLPSLERNCLSEFVQPQELIFQDNLLEYEKIASENLIKNPYWLFYESLIREERDGLAFLECVKAVQQCEKRKTELQIKFAENELAIFSASSSKKTNSEQKYKLQVENESIKREKEAILILSDIITALIAFVQIDRFRGERSALYLGILEQTSKSQASSVQCMAKMWEHLKSKGEKLMERTLKLSLIIYARMIYRIRNDLSNINFKFGNNYEGGSCGGKEGESRIVCVDFAMFYLYLLLSICGNYSDQFFEKAYSKTLGSLRGLLRAKLKIKVADGAKKAKPTFWLHALIMDKLVLLQEQSLFIVPCMIYTGLIPFINLSQPSRLFSLRIPNNSKQQKSQTTKRANEPQRQISIEMRLSAPHLPCFLPPSLFPICFPQSAVFRSHPIISNEPYCKGNGGRPQGPKMNAALQICLWVDHSVSYMRQRRASVYNNSIHKRKFQKINMHQQIKLENDIQGISEELHNLYTDSENNKIQWSSGHWTEEENAKCVAYFQFNKAHLHSKLKMKENKFFKQMSIFVDSRSPIQCRSQCQKLLRKYKTFFNIIQNFKMQYGQEKFDQEYEKHSRNPLIRFKGSLEMITLENQVEKCREMSIQTDRSFLAKKRLPHAGQEKGDSGKENAKDFPFMQAGWWA